jgi:hypothetical protein
MPLTRLDMAKLFQRLNDELTRQQVTGELYLVGGAVMCLVFDARPSTHDLDGYFRPVRVMREAARQVAADAEVDEHWLNDAVKGFLSPRGDFDSFLELSNLRVLTATPEYLLTMKCLATHLGAEFHDEADVRFLLRYLNVGNYREALDIVTRYYPLEFVPQKALNPFEEMLESDE